MAILAACRERKEHTMRPITMPIVEQLAAVATQVALTADLVEVPVNGVLTVIPGTPWLRLAREKEAELLERLVTAACTVVFDATREIDGEEPSPEEVYDTILRYYGSGAFDE